MRTRKWLLALPALAAAAAAGVPAASAQTPALRAAANHRHLEAGGEPVFRMGDTAWLLLGRLDRDEAEFCLATRQRQGFDVIRAMVPHTPEMTSRYNAPAPIGGDPARPRTTPGNDPAKPGEHDYWDHLDWVLVLDAAAARR